MNDTFDLLEQDQHDQWISATDLLGGALVIFFLFMLYFMMIERESLVREGALQQELQGSLVREGSLQDALQGAVKIDSVREVAVLYDQKRADLLQDLTREFGRNLPYWNAEILEDLTVRFNEPEVLFMVGSFEIREEFRLILEDFFPRYLATITQPKYFDHIAEVRIEGHTSSFWSAARDVQEAYLKNMDLSHKRTRSVLHFVMALPEVRDQLPWLRKHLTANGLSSARLIYDANGNEDSPRSQRVEFRVRTDAEARIARVLEEDAT